MAAPSATPRHDATSSPTGSISTPLVGRRFQVGNVECLGQRLCEPCSHLERLTTRGTLRELIHRGGLRADVLSDGEVTTGELIETID